MFQARKQWLLTAFILINSSCGGGDTPPSSNGGTSGSGGSRGGSGGALANTGTGGSGSGGSGSGGSGSGGSSGGSGMGNTTDPVDGIIVVRLVEATPDSPKAYTDVSGKIDDHPTPDLLEWTSVEKAGGCELRTPKAPFCPAVCGSDACVAGGKCSPYPNAKNVGKIQAKFGTTELTLEPILGAYSPTSNAALASPPCPEGTEISMKAAGGDYPGFTVTSKSIVPMVVTGADPLPFVEDQPLKLTWTPGKADLARVEVRVDISHHGGLRGEITCDVPDTGSLDVPGTMTGKLIRLGVSGFPTAYVTRVAAGQTPLAGGKVVLRVESKIARPLKIPGVDSCNEVGMATGCPAGKTCQKDFKCG